MPKKSYVLLENRGLIGIAGEDACSFLQGLVSNDVRKVAAGCAVHAAFLTPQGKYLHDFFIIQDKDGSLMLDGEAARLADLKKRLSMYKMRSKVEITDRSVEFVVAALLSEEAAIELNCGVAYADPRSALIGARAVLPRANAVQVLENAGFTATTFAEYDRLRISLGLADGSRDMAIDKALLLENGFDEMGSVDWNKGCYLGQELTARTKYRGLIRKRLLPVAINGQAPQPGAQVTVNGEDAGEMCSNIGDIGLALLRIECLTKADAAFVCGEATLTPHKPDWMNF